MNAIASTSYTIYFNGEGYQNLCSYLSENHFSKIFVLVDSNTKEKCLPNFIENITDDFNINIITIEDGEVHKNIDTCLKVWNELTVLEADRKSLLINLGGGMVTDLGGFVASTYKRGIKFINIPTTLLSMVDASVGSKTGVDLGSLKNLIGLFSDPEMVLIDENFLATMPIRELKSGYAEIIKYGLSYDKNLYDEIIHDEVLVNNLPSVIYRSILIKNEIVLKDLKEKSLRKILNFGHTVGHAIESFYLEHKDLESLTHGEAIAIGMVIESYISHKLFDFKIEDTEILKRKILQIYDRVHIKEAYFAHIVELMKHDKKNVNGEVKFVLLEAIGQHKIDCSAPQNIITEAINYYNS